MTINIDKLRQALGAVQPEEVEELLDRLEAAESDAAYQNAFAGSALRVAKGWEERCNALRAEIIHIKEVEFPRKAQAVADGWRGKLEAAEKERDDVAQQLVQSEIGKREISEAHNTVTRRLSVLADENAALRAKIAEMEKQEPVAHVWRCDNSHVHGSCERELPMGQQLYALPGAQPTPSVPKMEGR